MKFISTDTASTTELCHKAVASSTCEKFVQGQKPGFKLFNENSEIVVEYTKNTISGNDAGEYKLTSGPLTKTVQVQFATSKYAIVETTAELISATDVVEFLGNYCAKISHSTALVTEVGSTGTATSI